MTLQLGKLGPLSPKGQGSPPVHYWGLLCSTGNSCLPAEFILVLLKNRNKQEKDGYSPFALMQHFCGAFCVGRVHWVLRSLEAYGRIPPDFSSPEAAQMCPTCCLFEFSQALLRHSLSWTSCSRGMRAQQAPLVFGKFSPL